MTTASTMSALNSHMLPMAPRISFRRFVMLREAMPDMPAPSTFEAAGRVLTRLALASVPFGALGWLFIAH